MPCLKRSTTEENEEQSRMPSDSPFKQQKMKAWQPVLTASTVLPIFFLVGVIFVPIGIALLVASNNIKEIVIEYSEQSSCKKCVHEDLKLEFNCTCEVKFNLKSKWDGDIYFYYGLSNFYQNHRRYVRSRDDNQLNGKLSNNVNTNCKPFDKINNTAIVPCGAIANSMFNDTFSLKIYGVSDNVPLSDTGISWKSDRETKFKNPQNINDFDKYAKPPNWPSSIKNLENQLLNEDFIVWMRVAAFPKFRKLYRKFDREAAARSGSYKTGLPTGQYILTIHYNFPVKMFGGKKRFIMTTSSWIGGKNPFLGTCYIVVGCLCLVFGAIFLIIHMKKTK